MKGRLSIKGWRNAVCAIRLTNVGPRLFGVAYYAVFSLLGIYTLYWLVSLTSHPYGTDYQIYLDAYGDAKAGLNPYLPYVIGSSFVNHPFVLILVRLLFVQSGFLSMLIWSWLGIGAWLACFLMATALSRPQSPAGSRQSLDLNAMFYMAIFMVFGPFLETIAIGQVNTLALFCVLASVVLSERNRPVLAGVSLGIAILLKTSPALFLVYFLLVRQSRVVLTALVVILVLTLLSQTPFRTNVIENFMSVLPALSNEIQPSVYNQSLGSIVFRLLRDSQLGDLNTIVPFANKVALGVLICGLVWYGWRSAYRSTHTRMWLFVCFQVLAVAFSPLVWYHHYVFLLFPLLLLVSEYRVLVRVVGILVLTAFQVERFFETSAVVFPWPALSAVLMLLVSAYLLFIRSSLQGCPRDIPPNRSLEET